MGNLDVLTRETWLIRREPCDITRVFGHNNLYSTA